MQVLRTPDERFEKLPGYPFAPHYTDVPTGDGEGGTLRIHHVDEGPADGPLVLLMHGQPSWSYLYRHMIPLLVDAGCRVIAPDLVGYGRSDKPAAREDYSYQRQVDWLTAWLVANDFRGVTFFGQDWGGLIGLRLVAENEDRFERVVVANTGLPVPDPTMSAERIAEARAFFEDGEAPTMPDMMAKMGNPDPSRPEMTFVYWQKFCWYTEELPVSLVLAGSVGDLEPDEIAAYEAPFPDPSYKMGCRAMPKQVPTLADDPSIPANEAAWAVLERWEKPFVTAFSDDDPVTRGGFAAFQQRVPGAKGRKHRAIQGGGHFLQERRAPELVEVILETIRGS